MTPREIIAKAAAGDDWREGEYRMGMGETRNADELNAGHRATADRILEALRSAGYRIEPDWQPIETAPTDGTRFLAYDGGSHFDCWWHDYGYGEMGWRDEADSEPSPTYWRHLPAPPAIRALAKENQGC